MCRKFYRILVACFWVLFVWTVLHTFTPSTVTMVFNKHYESIHIKRSVVSITGQHDERFFHASDRRSDTDKDSFVSLLDNNVHIYSAIAYNTTKSFKFGSIFLSGWEDRMWARFYQPNYTCCLIYDTANTNILATRLQSKHDWYYIGKSQLEVKQFLCANVLRKSNRLPVAVSLGMDRQCPRNTSKYIRVDYPRAQEGDQLAVCAKLVYENISASSLIEWFEYQRHLGVSKVISYTYKLNAAAMSVLKYYESIGMAEYYPFNSVPQIGSHYRTVGVKNFQGWKDEQVPVYDCQGRLSGYTYIGLYDTDEYLYPKDGGDILQLLARLRNEHPNAAGFTFKTEVYATTWGAENTTKPGSSLTIAKYTMRTAAFRDRVKSIVITQRLEPGRLSTHGYWAKPPYKKPVISEEDATLKHYRTCRKEWMRNNGEMCFKTIQQVRDTSLLGIAESIKERVARVKQDLDIE